ncbi:uncharacterized protein LOC124826602 [Vigna umbellata]|uniref:uncharacterized protein LOC124826602 n=1 Tax=Vigna umbellata TaxID=87088 RepID=UPI001F5F4A2C|nr:uncharacterized protein LOC124826602 [Vigna umbellata]
MIFLTLIFLSCKDFFNYSKLMILDDYLGMMGVQHTKPTVSHNFFGSFTKLEFGITCNRSFVIPSHILPYLKNLKELNVHSSDEVEIIFDTDEIEVETKGIIFGLEKLTLKHLSHLNCVWKENLEEIVSFSNLQEVEVDGCGSLVTLFPLSLAKNLGKLETLEIQECEKMVEIVGRPDETEHGTTILIEFPCLSYLVLEKMSLLSCFYPGKHHLECPLLDRLYVECCPKLKVFRSSFDDDSKKEVLEAPINLQQPLFSIEKVTKYYNLTFCVSVSPKPVGLTLNEENIRLMSDARLSEDHLCKLKYLILSFEDDNNGKDSLPFDFFHKLPNLEYLTVQKCFGLKEIFPSQKLQVHDKLTLIFLSCKDFFNYSKLMILDDYLGMMGVQHTKPTVSHNFFGSFTKLEFGITCNRSFVIPSHILPYLKNLKELNVHSSDEVEIIFDTDEIEVETKGIIFGLEKLTLKHLSHLNCVWKENLEEIVSFSNLQEVEVDGCGSLVTLFPLSLAKNLGKLETLEIQECEKMVEIVGRPDETEHGTTILIEFPCLSYLVLEKMSLLSCFYPGKHHLECPLLDRLYVECCPKLKVFRSSFDDDSKKEVLEAPINLQQPLFSIEKVSPKPVGLTLNEENIRLMSDARLSEDHLCKLKYLILSFEDDNNGKDSLPFDFFHKLPNLEYLTVQKCFGLKEIFPSQKLQVHDNVLAGLKQLYLFELPKLESIGLQHTWVQPYSKMLELLKLRTCPRVESIVSCEVSFINLTKLSVKLCEKMEYLFTFATLKSLVKLTTLSIKNCESIKEIVKKENEDGCDEIICRRLRSIKLNSLPKLVSFYSGNATLQCSYLKNVMVAECPNTMTFSQGVIKVSTFHGDLYKTIQKLFPNQVSPKPVGLTLNEENIRLMSDARLSEDHLCKLKYLILSFEDDNNGKDSLPFDFFHKLPNLEYLTVQKCFGLKEIFPSQKLQVHDNVLAGLKQLYLFELPKLESIGLQHTWVQPYSKMLELLKLRTCPRVESIVSCEVSFINLTKLSVKLCEKMEYLFTFATLKSLVKLTTLSIKNCESIKEIVKKENEDGCDEIICRRLRSIKLNSLPKLVSFYSGNATLQCSYLKNVMVAECPNTMTFSQGVIKVSTFHGDLYKTIQKLFPNQVSCDFRIAFSDAEGTMMIPVS